MLIRQRVLFVLLALALLVVPAMAEPTDWTFAGQRAGRALYEGGWMQDFTVDGVQASPEFTFPLQLVYLSTREGEGMFGPQWFCPQLESTVLPQARGAFVWQMPSGGVMPFFENRDLRCHTNPSGDWHADVVGRRVVISNQEGWKYLYKSGQITAVISPTERVLNFKFSGDLLTEVELRDPKSGATLPLFTLTYDKQKRVRAVNVQGRVNEFTYLPAASKALMAWKRPNAEVVRFSYQDPGILNGIQIGARPPIALRTRYVSPKEGGRDQIGKVAKRDLFNYWIEQDDAYTYTYGENADKKTMLADQITLTDASGNQRKMEYSGPRGLLTASSAASGDEKLYYYRAPGQPYNGKLRRVERDGKIQIEYRYDRKTGLLSEIVDAHREYTFFDYPEVKSRTPGRTREGWEIKPVRVRKGERKNNRVVSEAKYDQAWRLTDSRDEHGIVTELRYSSRGDLATAQRTGEERSSFTYDAFGRVTSVVRGEQKESVEFDKIGRVAARVGVDGAKVEFERDEKGNVAKVTREGELLVENLFDANGRPAGEVDPLGRVRKIERDAVGNVTAEIAPNGVITRYEYDARGNRTAQIDGKGNRIEFTYDTADRLVQQVNPLGGTLTWKYDPAGQLTERTNGEQTIRYHYGADKKLARIDYGAGQTIDYVTDKKGRITSAATPTTRFEYEYDDKDRVEMTRATKKDDEQLVRYRYDVQGRRTGLLLAELVPAVASNGATVGKSASYDVLAQIDYEYNGAGRLSAISCNGLPIASYGYDGMGRPTSKRLGNEIATSISYDGRGRLGTMAFSGGPLSDAPTTLAYEWDAANQVTRRAWNGETQRYEYDPSGQLLKVLDDAKGASLEEYAYDKAGNMLDKQVDGVQTRMTYDAANQLTSVVSASLPSGTAAPTAYHYDRAGRMLGADGGARSIYGWLDKVTTLTTEDGRKIGYEYWPDGQLAAKRILTADGADTADGMRSISNSSAPSVPSAVETFLWDGLALLRRGDTIYINEPHPSGGAVIASFPVGNPDEMTIYLNDLLGTTLAAVNNGKVSFARLSAFGQQLAPSTTVTPNLIPVPGALSDLSQNQTKQQTKDLEP